MGGEKRKHHRQSLKYPAKIDIGGGTRVPCILADISASGARVIVDATDKIPERFTLLLAEQGTQRRCKVMWRKKNQLGLSFIKLPVAPRPGAGVRQPVRGFWPNR